MATVNQPGTAWSTDVKKANGAWTLRANGALAAGLTAEQTTADHGLAGVPLRRARHRHLVPRARPWRRPGYRPLSDRHRRPAGDR